MVPNAANRLRLIALRSRPVLVVPSHWLLPLGFWGTVFYGEQSVTIGAVLWVTVCSRIAKRIFTWCHPKASPGMDYSALRKSVIGF